MRGLLAPAVLDAALLSLHLLLALAQPTPAHSTATATPAAAHLHFDGVQHARLQRGAASVV